MPPLLRKRLAGESARPVDVTNPNDITTWSPNQASYSKTNPNPILGRLDPHGSWKVSSVAYLQGDDGQPILDREGLPIKDFPGWPRYISSKISGQDMEVLFRTSSRVTYRDIWVRQPSWVPKPDNTGMNMQNQRRKREGRDPYSGISWSRRYATRAPPKALVTAIEPLTQEQIAHNTTFKVHANGISFGDASQLLPLDYFLSGEEVHTPSDVVRNTLELLLHLGECVRQEGVKHWSELKEEFLPEDWRKRGQRLQSQTTKTTPVPDKKPGSPLNRQDNKRRKVDNHEETVDEGQMRRHDEDEDDTIVVESLQSFVSPMTSNGRNVIESDGEGPVQEISRYESGESHSEEEAEKDEITSKTESLPRLNESDQDVDEVEGDDSMGTTSDLDADEVGDDNGVETNSDLDGEHEVYDEDKNQTSGRASSDFNGEYEEFAESNDRTQIAANADRARTTRPPPKNGSRFFTEEDDSSSSGSEGEYDQPTVQTAPRLFYNEAGEAFTNYIDSLPGKYFDSSLLAFTVADYSLFQRPGSTRPFNLPRVSGRCVVPERCFAVLCCFSQFRNFHFHHL